MTRHKIIIDGAAGHHSRRLHLHRDEGSELLTLGIARSAASHPAESIIIDLDAADALIANLAAQAAAVRATRTIREQLRGGR